jgi:hypothetical protein
MGKEKVKYLILAHLGGGGCLAEVNVLINEKHKLGPKNVCCLFLGYTIHGVGYRFLITNSRVPLPNMHVRRIMESIYSTFLELFSYKKCISSHHEPNLSPEKTCSNGTH